jgi:hypothetical protein
MTHRRPTIARSSLARSLAVVCAAAATLALGACGSSSSSD